MSSPYGAPLASTESNSGDSAQRQPLRFPHPQEEHSWGQGGTPPPFVAPANTGTGGTGMTIPPTAPTGQEWGRRNETFFLPPQFSYNPDQQQPVAPPAPPKRSRKRLIIALSSAVTVVAAAVAGGIIVMSGSDSPKPATTGGQLASDSHTSAPPKTGATPVWSVKPSNPDPAAKTVIGSWLVNDHAVVRADATGLQAYDTETGRGLWLYTVPDAGSAICDASASPQGKIGVIRYGVKDNCTTVAAIDAENGHVLWTAPIPGGTGNPTITVGDDMVAGSAGNVVTVWNIGDGKKLWDDDLGKANPPCRLIQSAVQATSAALLADCGKGPTVLMKDAHTGADHWQTPLPPDGAPNAHHAFLQAAAPTIVHIDATPDGAPAIDHYYFVDDKGQLQATIEGTGPFGKLEPRVGPKAHQLSHLTGNTWIEPTAAKDPATGNAPAAGLVAFDVTTGKQLWQAPPLAGAPAAVVALNDDRTLVLDGGTADGPGARLLDFTTANGAAADPPIKDPLGPDWAGAAAGYLVGDRFVLVPATPRKGAAVVAFALK
ncbi:MAG: PQQ-binding-like beta-propeller repeat protein [Catenulispora sp.]|nr:PQQ-binding-like beta-propeller repeat protein [Catenulispora sp.]